VGGLQGCIKLAETAPTGQQGHPGRR
jgi:hypothetical protein